MIVDIDMLKGIVVFVGDTQQITENCRNENMAYSFRKSAPDRSDRRALIPDNQWTG